MLTPAKQSSRNPDEIKIIRKLFSGLSQDIVML